jgi:hypothetical protein
LLFAGKTSSLTGVRASKCASVQRTLIEAQRDRLRRVGLRAPRRDEVAFALEALDRLLKRRGCLVGLQHDAESNLGTVDAALET